MTAVGMVSSAFMHIDKTCGDTKLVTTLTNGERTSRRREIKREREERYLKVCPLPFIGWSTMNVV